MDGSYESSGGYSGDRAPFHRHSQSSQHLTMDFSAMHTSIPTPQTNAADVSRLSNGATYESHDDLCVDNCAGVGLYNGSQYFNHRGAQQQVFPPRWTGVHHGSDMAYAYPLGLDSTAMQFRTPFAPSQSGLYNDSWYVGQSQTGLTHNPQSADEDTESCCDSQCTMVGKCSNSACASKDDACTDLTCPERPTFPSSGAPSVPPEVANGAAALLSITNAPEPLQNFSLQQAHMMDEFDFDFAQNFFFWPSPDVGNVASHLLAAHADAYSSTCTRPCPLDAPRNYQNCPMPNLSDFNSQYSGNGPGMLQIKQDFVECGVQVHTPDAYIQHFNAQHRPEFFAANAQYAAADHIPMQNQAVMSSIEGMSSSPTTPLDTPDSGDSSSTPSPLTPMSHSMDMSEVGITDTKRSDSSDDRSMSVSSEDAQEHRCLWREEEGPDICGRIFSTPEKLFNHAATTHIKNAKKGNQGFRCGWDDCPRSEAGAAGFPQRSKIERHMQTHIDHKPHICPTCHKGFSAKQALSQHMFIHTNQKPLECNICHKAFRYPSALTMHQRVHTGEKPLSCPICGKSFSESSNLSKHKRTHEVKGRYSCHIIGCDRNFHRQDQLRRHMKTHGDGVDMLATKLEGVSGHFSQE